MIRPQRIGLVGFGQWGRQILRDLLALGCEVTVRTRTEASAARAVEAGAAHGATALASLRDVDGIVVATPSTTHATVTRSVLDLGVPVFVEKPLTIDVDDARDIVARAGERVFVMDKWRYHPGVQRLRELVGAGTLGEVFGLRTVRVSPSNPHDDADIVWHVVPHDLSVALEIAGAIPVPTSALAHREGGVGSGLFGHLTFEDGRWMTLEVAANAPTHTRRIDVYGSDGVASLADGWDEHVILTRTPVSGAQEVTTIDAAGELPLLAELRAFVDHLAGGPPPRSSAAEGLRAVETIAQLRTLAGLDA